MPSQSFYKTVRNNKALMLILMFVVMGLAVFVLNYTTRQLEGFYVDGADVACVNPESEECKKYLQNTLN